MTKKKRKRLDEELEEILSTIDDAENEMGRARRMIVALQLSLDVTEAPEPVPVAELPNSGPAYDPYKDPRQLRIE